MGVSSLPKTVTRQRRDCDLNPDPSAPESIQHANHSATEPPFNVILLAFAAEERRSGCRAAIDICWVPGPQQQCQ